jgi:hypothetical protein
MEGRADELSVSKSSGFLHLIPSAEVISEMKQL